ncbi:MAG: HD domain-containing protein [Flavobacteriales bacterium]|nr:HD domain-containing protein [Flavobacteriales bacterium]
MDQPGAEAYILGKLRHGLPAFRTYHCFSHTLDVYRTAVEIAVAEGIEGERLDLLRTAALYHDAGFLIQDKDHEEGSCLLASEALPKFGYTHSQVDAVCEMVRATKVPQQPRNKLSRILCDADLDYLGRPDFFRIGATLFTEFKHYAVVKTEREWNELQVRFLSKHRYFTAHSKRVRQPVKQLHLAAVKDWLERDAEGMAAH